ncbi:xaa-Pro dipeptidase isoform X4 [Trichogramma pretiosum]|uniref:xaa-Pro dipeptidase isoform X4 n=1 Tax=Trichogramma pretiosum TaxID=7493 RepID=UPI0006C9D278|nr:xaa-Pro dipeptidase isoform X4 [Trichogramma pretiosum]
MALNGTSAATMDNNKIDNGPMESHFVRGEHTMRVPMSLFADNRKRLIDRLRTKHPRATEPGSVVLLKGGDEVSLYCTDVSWPFKQESFFQWCFGVEEPECYGALDLASGKSILFFPRHPAEYATWMGRLCPLEEFRQRYQVDETYHVDELERVLSSKGTIKLLLLRGVNSDSGLTTQPATFDGIDKFQTDFDILYPEFCECRVIKSPKEIEVLRYVVKVSSDAHKAVMRMVKPGVAEFQAEAQFLHHAYAVGGCRHVSYTCICGSGENGSILHYGHAGAPNNKVLKDGDMCLFDMGGNYAGYAADITCSFPANGKFTEDQKIVYNAVLDARNAVLQAAKPGVLWSDMHLLANRVMLEALKKADLLQGDVEDMIRSGVHAVFQPHGLGHFLGLDVHDVGGYLPGHPERSAEPGLSKLRTARPLKAGMVLTVEPGCYFIDWLLQKAKADPAQAKFINWANIERFRGFGGVRIEDDVLITETGMENLTDVPRTVEEIEEWMSYKRAEIKLPQELKHLPL